MKKYPHRSEGGDNYPVTTGKREARAIASITYSARTSSRLPATRQLLQSHWLVWWKDTPKKKKTKMGSKSATIETDRTLEYTE